MQPTNLLKVIKNCQETYNCDLDIAIDSGWIGKKCAEVRTRDKISLGVIHILRLTLTLLKYHSNSIPFN